MQSSKTTLTIPPEHLSLHGVLLPAMPAHRLQAALAGALEEHLLDDPADLHFALLPTAQADCKAGKPISVMVCNKAWLQGLIDKAFKSGQRITSIVPEDAALRAAGWDLAQGGFAPRGALGVRLTNGITALWQGSQWRAARIALLLLVLVQIVGLNLWAWRDRAALADKRAALSSVLIQTFPKTQVVIDPIAQMTKSVAALRTGSGQLTSTDLENQLAAQSSGKSLVQIDFARGKLTAIEALTPATPAQPLTRSAP